jgi:hypothetical protein
MKKLCSVPHHLPDQELIAKRQITPDMIFRSSKRLSGGNDFNLVSLYEGRLSAGKAGSLQVKKHRYALNRESFQGRDKFLSIDAMRGSLRKPPDIKGEVSPEKTEKGG